MESWNIIANGLEHEHVSIIIMWLSFFSFSCTNIYWFIAVFWLQTLSNYGYKLIRQPKKWIIKWKVFKIHNN